MARPDSEEERPALGKFPRYPAPGRPEQPMPSPSSGVPWLVFGVIITVLTALGSFVALIAVLPDH